MKNYTITVNGNVYDVVVEEGTTNGVVSTNVPKTPKVAPKAAVSSSAGSEGSVKIEAGAAGKVFKVDVAVGQAVKSGDTVIILEAMKMEIPVVASQDGTVASINVSVGDAIEAGAVLITLN